MKAHQPPKFRKIRLVGYFVLPLFFGLSSLELETVAFSFSAPSQLALEAANSALKKYFLVINNVPEELGTYYKLHP